MPKYDDRKLEECIYYFTSNAAFGRLFAKIREKYASLGYIGGRIILENPSTEEMAALGGLMRKDYTGQKTIAVRLEEVQQAIDRTKFRGLSLEEFLRAYFGEEIVSNKESTRELLGERSRFFSRIAERFGNTMGGKWLEDAVVNKRGAYKMLIRQYETNRNVLMIEIENVCVAVNSLPIWKGGKMRLAVFASTVTKNPHSFDYKTIGGRLLVYTLSYMFKEQFPSNAEERAWLYYQGGILSDEVSSFVLTAGLHACTKDGIHRGWEGFFSNKEAVLATLSNIGSLTEVFCDSPQVFVVENPAVFAAICDAIQSENVPIVCTNGQVGIAALALLDMLNASGVCLYYSGDFDPEGLQIADKLWVRYSEKLVLWRFSHEDYMATLSDNLLGGIRLNKMNSLKNPQLQILAQAINEEKKAAYQERLTVQLCNDIKEFLNIEYGK